MNYSLGNMLSRGGALNPDGLSLDLAFAADKTLTARKGPTPTFTRASTATFVGSDGLIQSAAINAPRFDHDPVTLACKGLLIEESRTNLALRSEEFDNSSWGSGSVTRTANQIDSPSGSTSADLITSITGNFGGKLSQNFTFLATTYTASVFVKKGNWRYVGIQLADVSSSAVIPSFDFDTETVSQNGTSFSTLSVQKLANGWYRLSLTQAATAIFSTFAIWLTASNGNVTGPIGAGNTLYVWGAQLETGSFPTSYIPTTTTALTRSADVCSVTTAGWANAGDDTMLASYFVRQHVVGAIIVEGGPLISWLSLAIGSISGSNRAIYRHGGTATRFDASTTATYSLASMNKLALTSGEQLCLNGSLGQVVTGDPSQSDISTILSIGRRSDFLGQAYINGHIARIQYFRKRLPNAKLQSLTTP